ncbi:CD2 antigen cytoplasmic tail-binding protein 2 homolog [Microplitis mediator]|uniref:CD2 antigen cytoplasmic tail-binding protein 2 homolog n=1 Tax=Microplitis mediator TaxID=375433 RepID=UPI0025569116|nr:CD2 antigen cytoplasmic tail-binding protein 2 homolog [Microplitis mediator]XP_057339949.1 CD2 antigen cytoplasmic tail-binding protein 2 homolog [Microplitis mediator]XP_057339950.1 CD2 antigen cytoplasmic tail-binding protein 2 homolog [Microplitis mediator]
MPKRKLEQDSDVLSHEKNWSRAVASSTNDSINNDKTINKNSLDSDEEDDEANEDNYNVMDENDIEGVEEGPMAKETKVGFTAFNMKEELEEGHFDKDGHYLWKKEKQIRDNWLDNIDWVKVDSKEDNAEKNDTVDEKNRGLADSDSDDDESLKNLSFDPTELYRQIFDYLQPGETVSKALCRLGKGKKKISSAERWKRKKAGLSETDENSEKIIKLTELSNELLTRTGNMNIYQETYEVIKRKINLAEKQSHPAKHEAESDMFADDFELKEKQKNSTNPSVSDENKKDEDLKEEDEVVKWELKWSQNDDAEINGPHTTEQMQTWAKEGYFKKGAWVKRVGQAGQFYSAARVDFELYL